MLVKELIKRLSRFPENTPVKIVAIKNVDELPKGEDWSEGENFRIFEGDPLDVYSDKDKVIIQ